MKILFFGTLVSLATAAEPESSLIKVIVNTTDDTLETQKPCLRAEFTAEIIFPGETAQKVPSLQNDSVSVDSDCGGFKIEKLSLGENATTEYDLEMIFKNEEDKKWMVTRFALMGSNNVTFSNESLPDVGAPLSGVYGQSFLCTAGFDVDLWNGEQKVILRLARLQLQPFKVPEDTFANPVICVQDISIVVPAIVGSILGLLVIIVLVTYIIGRRRTRIAYQEI